MTALAEMPSNSEELQTSVVSEAVKEHVHVRSVDFLGDSAWCEFSEERVKPAHEPGAVISCASSERGRHVNDAFACRHELLCEQEAKSFGTLDGPCPRGVAGRPSAQLFDMRPVRSDLQRSELVFLSLIATAVCDALCGSISMITCMKPPTVFTSQVGTAEGTPTFGRWCWFLSRALRREIPIERFSIESQAPGTASWQALRERANRGLQRYENTATSPRILK